MMSQSDDIQTGVLNALYWDLAVPRFRVKVEVANGWVTISGMVDRPYQRTCAESDALRVPGVIGVINHIRLGPARAHQSNHHYARPNLRSELIREQAAK
jgi:osmotically-inducible protein OsmY